jgi:hypothetical protein
LRLRRLRCTRYKAPSVSRFFRSRNFYPRDFHAAYLRGTWGPSQGVPGLSIYPPERGQLSRPIFRYRTRNAPLTPTFDAIARDKAGPVAYRKLAARARHVASLNWRALHWRCTAPCSATGIPHKGSFCNVISMRDVPEELPGPRNLRGSHGGLDRRQLSSGLHERKFYRPHEAEGVVLEHRRSEPDRYIGATFRGVRAGWWWSSPRPQEQQTGKKRS